MKIACVLPKEFQFDTDDVFIRKEGEDVILSPRPTDWASYLDGGSVACEAVLNRMRSVPVTDVCISVVTKSDLNLSDSCPPRL